MIYRKIRKPINRLNREGDSNSAATEAEINAAAVLDPDAQPTDENQLSE